jgi:hypothetical protein
MRPGLKYHHNDEQTNDVDGCDERALPPWQSSETHPTGILRLEDDNQWNNNPENGQKWKGAPEQNRNWQQQRQCQDAPYHEDDFRFSPAGEHVLWDLIGYLV